MRAALLLVLWLSSGCATTRAAATDATASGVEDPRVVARGPSTSLGENGGGGSLDGPELIDELNEIQQLTHHRRAEEALVRLAPILERFEAAYRDSPKLVFSAWNMQETLIYAALSVETQKESIVLGPAWGLAWFLEGYALAELKRYREAEAALERAVKLSPRHANFLAELGFVQQSLGRPLVAIATFEQALTAADLAEKPEQDKLRARARRGIGFNQIELGSLDEAEKSFREALKLDPEDRIAVGELEYIRRQRQLSH